MYLAQYKKKGKDYWYESFLKREESEMLREAMSSKGIDYVLKYTKKEDIIMEGGCSTGRYLRVLRFLGYSKVYGFEIDKKMVHLCKKEALKVKYGTILKIPYPDKFANLYLELGVIEHFTFAEQKKILKEIHRILKKEGIIIITFAYLNLVRLIAYPYMLIKNKYNEKKGFPFHQWIYSKECMRRLLEESGFEILEFNHHVAPRALFVAKKV